MLKCQQLLAFNIYEQENFHVQLCPVFQLLNFYDSACKHSLIKRKFLQYYADGVVLLSDYFAERYELGDQIIFSSNCSFINFPVYTQLV